MPSKPKTFSQLKSEMGLGGRKVSDRAYEHKRMSDPKLAASKRFRNSRRWQRFRDWFKKKHPICCDPLGLHPNIVEQTAHVHHIIGITERMDLALVESNCAPVCIVCHNKLEGLIRAGKPTKHLFDNIERKTHNESY